MDEIATEPDAWTTTRRGNPVRFFKSLWSIVFSFEFFFVVFLFAGVFKENPRLSWIPFDLTGIGLVFSFLIAVKIMFQRNWVVPRPILRSILVSGIFFIWVCVSLSWSGSWDYGVGKFLQLLVMGFWGYVGGSLVIGGDTKRLRRLGLVIVLLSLWMAGELIGLVISGSIMEEWEFASNYLGFGRLLGLSVIILVGMFLWGRLGAAVNLVLVVVQVFLVSVLMISGGRGPFLATLAVMVIPIVRDMRLMGRGPKVERKLLWMGGLLLVVLVGFFLVGNRYFGYTTIDRILVSLDSGGGSSARERLWFFEKAWTHFLDAPLVGHGVGSFGTLIGWGDVRAYPHNMVLEILVELGLVGLALFAGFCITAFKGFSLSRIRSDAWAALVLMLFLNTALNAMVSGDLPDNRMFFAMLGLCAGRFSRPLAAHLLSGPGQHR